MWEIMNVIHPSKDATKLPTEEELKSEGLRPLREIGDSIVFANSLISKIFPPKE
jgi:hypothetical protein